MSTADDQPLYDRMMAAYNALRTVGTTGGTARLGESLGNLIPSGGLGQGLDPTRLADPRMVAPRAAARDLGLAPTPSVPAQGLPTLSVSAGREAARALQAGARDIQRGGTFGQAEDVVAKRLGVPPSVVKPAVAEEETAQMLKGRIPSPSSLWGEGVPSPAHPPSRSEAPARRAAPAMAAAVPPRVGAKVERTPPGRDFMGFPPQGPGDRPWIEAIIGGERRRQYSGGEFAPKSGDTFLNDMDAHLKLLENQALPGPEVKIGPDGSPQLDYAPTVAARNFLLQQRQQALEAKGTYLSHKQTTEAVTGKEAQQRSVEEEKVTAQNLREVYKENPNDPIFEDPATRKRMGLPQLDPDQQIRALQRRVGAPGEKPEATPSIEALLKMGSPLQAISRAAMTQEEINQGIDMIQRGYPPGTSMMGRILGGAAGTPQQKFESVWGRMPAHIRPVWKQALIDRGLIDAAGRWTGGR